jgi:hypothetical protein
MAKKKCWLVCLGVVCTLVVAALACVFPATVAINGGLVPSAIDDGYAIVDLTKAGCDCDTSVETGKLKYTDGQGADMVHFTGKIDYTLDPGCQIPGTNVWATGTYFPPDGTSQGTFYVGLFGDTYEGFDPVKCAECPSACWRLWLVGGQFDGYQNWACGLVNEEALTYTDHLPGSPCASE